MCDTLAIVTSDGVLFAKNSDRDANEAQRLEWQPRQCHAPGTILRCTWIEIPQVAATHAVLISRPYWMWGAEMGTNEHGVTIGNEAVFTRAGYAASGLTGMDLLRLALERAATAESAVDTIVNLLQEFGQGGLCCVERQGFTYHNSFIIADPRRAFVLETAGQHHAAEEIRGARSISNGLTIPAFARQHGDTIKTYVSGCRLRQAQTQRLAERADSPGALVRILRDHGPGHDTPHYAWLNGGLNAPCVHAGGLLAASQTTGSWVAELRPGEARHWATATAAPCTSLFKPIAVDEPVEAYERASANLSNRADDTSLWWRHERLHRCVLRDPARLGRLYFGERDELERAWLGDPPASAAAFSAGAELESLWTEKVLAAHVPDSRRRLVARYWQCRNRQAGLELAAARAPQAVA